MRLLLEDAVTELGFLVAKGYRHPEQQRPRAALNGKMRSVPACPVSQQGRNGRQEEPDCMDLWGGN